MIRKSSKQNKTLGQGDSVDDKYYRIWSQETPLCISGRTIEVDFEKEVKLS